MQNFQLLSPVFKDGGLIPIQYTCKGQNINPPLNILGVPQAAKSLALIMHDPDAVNTDFTHWLLWDISTSTESIAPNSVPVGAVQGRNSAGTKNYTGPCPPAGTNIHHYIFELYALDKNLSLDSNSDRAVLQSSMEGHSVSTTKLTGLLKSEPKK